MNDHNTHNNNDYLRMTLLSLEGIQLTDDASSSSSCRIITVYAGFHTTNTTPTSLPCQSISIFSSQLYNYDDNYCLVAVGSEETKFPDGKKDGACTFAVHWRECIERTTITGEQQNNNFEISHEQEGRVQAVDDEEKFVPHVEIKLPSDSPNQQKQIDAGALEDVVEFHICVVCTSSSTINDVQQNKTSYYDDDFIEHDNDDSMSDEEHCRQDQQHVCHGVAKLTLTSFSSEIALSSGCNRPRGKIVLLPIQPLVADNVNIDNEEVVKLSTNAMLSVQIERIPKPTTTKRDQYHYIESKWRGNDNFAPASIDNFEEENEKNQSAFGKLVRRATSTLTMMGEAVINTPPRTKKQCAAKAPEANNTQQPPVLQTNDADKDTLTTKTIEKQQQEDQMVGRVIEAIIEHRCPSSSNASSSDQQGRDMPTLSSSTQIKSSTTSTPKQSQSAARATDGTNPTAADASADSNTPPQLTLQERFLCGATFVTDFGNALQMAAAAGHHCDEDHVGLYVVDSDEDSNANWENL